jgi:hypothetical protein
LLQKIHSWSLGERFGWKLIYKSNKRKSTTTATAATTTTHTNNHSSITVNPSVYDVKKDMKPTIPKMVFLGGT